MRSATLGVTNTVVRVYSDVTVTKDVTGPADGLVPTDRPFTGTISCQYGTDAPIVTTWSATLAIPALRSGVLVGSVCAATEDPPGAGGQPVTGDPSYIWLEPVIGDPVTVTPPTEATPPIAVTNPTERLFGTFRVSKLLTGADGRHRRSPGPYPMTFSCQPGSGDADHRDDRGRPGSPARRGPGRADSRQQHLHPDRTAGHDAALRDSAWSWDPPTFTVDGVATPGAGQVADVHHSLAAGGHPGADRGHRGDQQRHEDRRRLVGHEDQRSRRAGPRSSRVRRSPTR